jgi:hypothetical protein
METKREYIERELKAWKEQFEIPFEDEYKVKILHDLRYTYENTPDDHVKTKADIIHAIQNLARNLKLKPRQKLKREDKEIHLIVTNNRQETYNTFEFFKELIDDNKIVSLKASPKYAEIETTSKIIKIMHKTESELFRGIRFHTYWNLTRDILFEEQVLRIGQIKNELN